MSWSQLRALNCNKMIIRFWSDKEFLFHYLMIRLIEPNFFYEWKVIKACSGVDYLSKRMRASGLIVLVDTLKVYSTKPTILCIFNLKIKNNYSSVSRAMCLQLLPSYQQIDWKQWENQSDWWISNRTQLSQDQIQEFSLVGCTIKEWYNTNKPHFFAEY